MRPLCRGLILAAAIGLPALGPLAARHRAADGTPPEPARLALASGHVR